MLCQTYPFCRNRLLRLGASRLTVSRQIPSLSFSGPHRAFSTQFAEDVGNDKASKLHSLLDAALKPRELDVVDVSGGCGASFRVRVVSDAFKGKSMLQQHQAVNAALRTEFKDLHALQLETAAPSD